MQAERKRGEQTLSLKPEMQPVRGSVWAHVGPSPDMIYRARHYSVHVSALEDQSGPLGGRLV